MSCYDYNPYVLPTVDFVGGSSQDLLFNVFSYSGHKPFSLIDCSTNFSVVSFLNKEGEPVIRKSMTVRDGGEVANVLQVHLEPQDTVDLDGKFIYQITIRDAKGNTEIPQQGIMYITNNINKSFIH